jgi:hypothetical protein
VLVDVALSVHLQKSQLAGSKLVPSSQYPNTKAQVNLLGSKIKINANRYSVLINLFLVLFVAL